MSERVANRNEVVLAQSAAADLRTAACKGMGVWWSAQEATINAGATKPEGRAAAQELLEVCWAGCPVRAACRELAQDGRYTGVAGGAVLRNGTPRHIPGTASKIAS
jgi:hypothetical protein